MSQAKKSKIIDLTTVGCWKCPLCDDGMRCTGNENVAHAALHHIWWNKKKETPDGCPVENGGVVVVRLGRSAPASLPNERSTTSVIAARK